MGTRCSAFAPSSLNTFPPRNHCTLGCPRMPCTSLSRTIDTHRHVCHILQGKGNCGNSYCQLVQQNWLDKRDRGHFQATPCKILQDQHARITYTSVWNFSVYARVCAWTSKWSTYLCAHMHADCLVSQGTWYAPCGHDVQFEPVYPALQAHLPFRGQADSGQRRQTKVSKP